MTNTGGPRGILLPMEHPGLMQRRLGVASGLVEALVTGRTGPWLWER